MSRSTILLLLVLAGLVAVIIYLSTIDTQVETSVIEEPVPDEALED